MKWLDWFNNYINDIALKKEERIKQSKRSIPDYYFRKGYRRLANTAKDIKEQKCWTCKHGVGYIAWRCDLDRCKYERCYIKDEITTADYEASYNDVLELYMFVGLPNKENK